MAQLTDAPIPARGRSKSDLDYFQFFLEVLDTRRVVMDCYDCGPTDPRFVLNDSLRMVMEAYRGRSVVTFETCTRPPKRFLRIS